MCLKCAKLKLSDKCLHKNNERAFTGTWTTSEVDLALEKGYKIIRINEIWHWSTKENLFESYVNQFIKIKQENSGYPSDVKTEEEKQIYIQDYYQNEGVLLDYDKIIKNSGYRCISKMMLNSNWGYFAIQPNKTQHKFLSTRAAMLELLNNDEYIVNDIIPTENDELMQIFYTKKDDMIDYGNYKSNVVIAAFVTSFARIKLYKEITKLENRVLYIDTDSMIFISKEGCYEPSTGKYLGELTDEIGDDLYITEYCSGGSKNYAYKLNNGDTKCVIKGFSQSLSTIDKLNFETIKKIVCEDQLEKITVNQNKFSRNKNTWNVYTNDIEKTYGFCYDKRIILNDYNTLPYGY